MKKIGIVFLVIVVLLSINIIARQYHPPSEVDPGTFQSGNYIFPNNVSVGTSEDYLYHSSNCFVVNGTWSSTAGVVEASVNCPVGTTVVSGGCTVSSESAPCCGSMAIDRPSGNGWYCNAIGGDGGGGTAKVFATAICCG